jgi:hypothetical protein
VSESSKLAARSLRSITRIRVAFVTAAAYSGNCAGSGNSTENRVLHSTRRQGCNYYLSTKNSVGLALWVALANALIAATAR